MNAQQRVILARSLGCGNTGLEQVDIASNVRKRNIAVDVAKLIQQRAA
jgi:hypothetical protein